MGSKMKFRVWDGNRLWKSGETDSQGRQFVLSSDGNLYLVNAEKWQPVRNCKVELTTGKKDGQGTDIFDGDIIKSERGTFVVFWDAEQAMFSVDGFVWFDRLARGGVEVIGNVHENAELLRDGYE